MDRVRTKRKRVWALYALAAVVVPRVGGGSGFDERGLRDQTQAALRYAKQAAILLPGNADLGRLVADLESR